VQYRIHLLKDYGEKIVKELEQRRWKVDPIKDWEKIKDALQKGI